MIWLYSKYLKTFISILFLFISHTASPIYFRQLSMKDGLSHFSVISIYQDIHGRMWFGTHEGLSIYNGRQIKVFKPSFPSGLSSVSRDEAAIGSLVGNRISSITGDKEGNVFFLADQALMRYDIRKQRFDVIKKNNVCALTLYEGAIWCASNDSILTYDPVDCKLKFSMKTNLSDISSLFISDNKHCWVGTRRGLYVSNDFKNVSRLIPSARVHSIFQDSQKDIWVSTWKHGLYKISATGTILHIPYDTKTSRGIAGNPVREIEEDNSGNIWFGTFEGLQKYNPITGEFTLYKSTLLPGSLSHSSVYALYKDNQGTIWVGSYFGGVNYFNPEKDLFTFYPYGNGQSNELNFPLVGNMVEDCDRNLWICTEGGGLNCLNRNKRTIRSFTMSPCPESLPHNNLKSICYDEKRHYLYIGTHTGGLSRFDIARQSFKNYKKLYKGGKEVPGDIIHKVMLYKDTLFVAARNGTFMMDPDTETFQLIGDDISYPTFEIDADGYMWTASENFISRINLKYPHDLNSPQIYPFGSSGVTVSRIFDGNDGFIYIGTFGNGLYVLNKQDETITHFTVEKDKLLSNYCYNITMAKMGQLLITTDKGIMFFSPSDHSIKVIKLGIGLPFTSIVENCGVYICHDNEIFVGGMNGMVSFREKEIDNSISGYNLYFEELLLNNKSVYPDDETGILETSLPFTDHIDLQYEQNNLTFKFATSNYVDLLSNNQYEYKLEGFDKEWISTDNTVISYTNLNPGNYVLKIRESLLYVTYIPKEISLPITIYSPWYNTFWAWIVYVLAGSLIVFQIWQAKKARLVLALSLREERNDKERIEKLNQAKLRFFTNISHEFRTPLTLILSHLDILLQNNSFSPIAYSKLKKIYKHAYQMRNLITELLDFRKFGQQQISLHVSEQDVVAFLKDIYLSFSDYAVQHNISYRLLCGDEKIIAWFDMPQMQKVFFNLLSNAFKYTPDGRQIELEISKTEDHIVIKTIDTGIGLSAVDKEKIFDCFYQVENNEALASNPGTGIGLALTKSIIQLHQGTISVESQLEYGSIFIVTLKSGLQHFVSDKSVVICEKQQEPTLKTATLPDFVFGEQFVELPEQASTHQGVASRYTVLLVEDNEELMQILSSLFSPFYTVTSAFNGKEGLEKAISEHPDLIISDVMMPEMSGTEMCLRIKKDINLCHIPIILLSALNSDEQNVEGLQCGADDYVGKPFNAQALLLRCNNQIRNRINLQNKFTKQENFEFDLLATNALDKEFLNQIVLLIEKHLDETDFDVNQLAKEMGLSRSSFFSKFKSLTGITPASFMQDYKLKKATKLLIVQPYLQISEISDRLGFNTPHYFGRCFKTKYNLTPLEYRKDKLPTTLADS